MFQLDLRPISVVPWRRRDLVKQGVVDTSLVELSLQEFVGGRAPLLSSWMALVILSRMDGFEDI